MSYEIEHRYATLNGHRMHYACCGNPEKPLLLCLHGFPESWLGWRGVLQTLGQQCFVVAPDTRGINESEGPDDLRGYRANHMAADVAALLDHLGVRQCVLAGHDWGGAIASTFAIAYPERLHGLVLVNSTHPAVFARELMRSPAQREASAYIKLFLQEDAEGTVSADDFAYLRGMLALNSQTGAPPSWFDEQLSAAYRQAWAQPGTVRAGLSYYRASQFLNPVDGDERASGATRSEDLDLTIRVPTQFIWGERDGFLLSGCIEDIEPFFTNLRVARIPEGSHWVIHEHGETVAQHISGFVNSLDLSGGADDPAH